MDLGVRDDLSCRFFTPFCDSRSAPFPPNSCVLWGGDVCRLDALCTGTRTHGDAARYCGLAWGRVLGVGNAFLLLGGHADLLFPLASRGGLEFSGFVLLSGGPLGWGVERNSRRGNRSFDAPGETAFCLGRGWGDGSCSWGVFFTSS